MVTTLGRRVVLLVATVLMALMMALPTASSDPGNGKGFGQGKVVGILPTQTTANTPLRAAGSPTTPTAGPWHVLTRIHRPLS